MPLRSHRRSTRVGRAIIVTALIATLSLMVSSAVWAGDPPVVLRTAPEGVPLQVADIDAGYADDLAVVWQEDRAGGPRSFIRWSHDLGTSFEPKERLAGWAAGPRVAVCDFIWTSSTSMTGAGPEITVEFWDPPAPTLFGDHGIALERPGTGADLTCHQSTVAVAWFDTSTSPAHVRLRIWVLTDACSDPCITTYTADLGHGRPDQGLTVAGTGNRVSVAWMRGAEMRFRRMTVDWNGGTLDVDPDPTRTLFTDHGANTPRLAAGGTRVVLAYGDSGSTKVRISEDRGATFMPARTVLEAPCTDCEAGSLPSSVDVKGERILVEVLSGGPAGTGSIGFLSADGGERWCECSEHAGANQVGAFAPGGEEGFGQIAEAWDRYHTDVPRQKLRFDTSPLACGC